jgi:hypothetical protein
MEIITQESLAKNFIKHVLADLWEEYQNDKEAHKEAQSFDEYVWNQVENLGRAAYEQIGSMYVDLDDAVNEVGLNG